MIAVFSVNRNHFEELSLRPKSKFIYVRTINDLRGAKIEGVVNQGYWIDDAKKCEAYEYLLESCPEIFK
jgi:hypothetical protein